MEVLRIPTGVLESITDITDEVLSYVEKARIKHGILVLQTPDNTCSVLTLSTEVPQVTQDLKKRINLWLPVQEGWEFNGYQMNNIRSAFIGNSKTLLIEGGCLVMGPYERIFFIDYKGPSDGRLLVMDAFGEKLAEGEKAELPEEILSHNQEVVRKKEEADAEEQRVIEEMLKEREERIAREREAQALKESLQEDKEDNGEEESN